MSVRTCVIPFYYDFCSGSAKVSNEKKMTGTDFRPCSTYKPASPAFYLFATPYGLAVQSSFITKRK